VVVTTLAEVFGARQVAILLQKDEGLEVVASAGEPLPSGQLRRVQPARGGQTSLDFEQDGLLVLALTAAGRPVGLLVVSGDAATHHEREPLLLFANHIALAIEREQLRDQALQTRLAEEMGRLAKTLVSAVSHDLRAPLSRIKASSSTLADTELEIEPEKTRRLARLIDVQADRLADLVQNLLDMSRIQAGVLQPRRSVAPLGELVASVVSDLTSDQRARRICVDIPADLPPIDADLVLTSRVLTNLLENAVRYSPKDTPIMVCAVLDTPQRIEVSVADHGPGVSPKRRSEIFELFARRDSDTGTGLGLTIAKTFIEAHGQRIWVDGTSQGGAVFRFTLPIAELIPEELRVATGTHH
jgi:two-component system sensor histidine kinase KdpD